MFFVNLSLGEFLALFGAVSGLLVALYLLDRSRQRVTVSTLRFWRPAAVPTEQPRRRRHIRQPLSLLLQIASIALLLLAIAQLRIGAGAQGARDHVLILDTSAWMAAGTPAGRLIDEAQRSALAWLRSLPADDRVLVLYAASVPTPATRFETDRKVVEQAIRVSEPGWTALDLTQSLAYARRLLSLHSKNPGEIVLAGAARISGEPPAPSALPSNLRLLPVRSTVSNCGLRRIAVRRRTGAAPVWEILVSVRNDGPRATRTSLGVSFAGRPIGGRQLRLAPGEESEAVFELRTQAGGWLEVRLLPGDQFRPDDRALLELPGAHPVHVLVCSDRPAWLRPLLAANPNVQAEFRDARRCTPGRDVALVILDGVIPSVPLRSSSIWINPDARTSPLPVRQMLQGAALRWRRDQPLTEGLRTRDFTVATAGVFQAGPGDLVIAEAAAGPVVVAQPGPPPRVLIGFDPAASRLRFELATPLLFANLFRWLAPRSFDQVALSVGSPGLLTLRLAAPVAPEALRVQTEEGMALPFTVRDGQLRVFVGSPAQVRIEAGEQTLISSLTAPDSGDRPWQPAQGLRRGVPAPRSETSGRDLWQVLAILAGLGLVLEWIRFGRSRVHRRAVASPVQAARLRALLRKVS